MGRFLVIYCLILVAILFIVSFDVPMGWFGNLPGDMWFEMGSYDFYFPFTSVFPVALIMLIFCSLLQN